MLKNGVLVGFGPSDPKENLILSLEVEHVKSNFNLIPHYIAGQFLKNSSYNYFIM